MFASGRESGPRHVWQLPGKADTQKTGGREGRIWAGRGAVWTTARGQFGKRREKRWRVVGAQDVHGMKDVLMAATWESGFHTQISESDLEPNPSVDSVLRLLSLLLSFAFSPIGY